MRTDHELIKAYQQGDVAAFEALVRRYWLPVHGFVRQLVKNDAVAEEVLAETFFKLHRAAPRYEPRARFSTFLFTIAHHEAMSVLRAVKRRGITESISPCDRDGSRKPVELESREPAPDTNVANKELLQKVNRILELLPDAHRASFILFYREALSIREIAQVLDVQPSSVRAYLTRARAALRTELSAADGATSSPFGKGG